jgi:hypothetical protein
MRGRGGGDRRSGSRRVAKDQCLNCGETRHWSRDCISHAGSGHLAQEDNDKPTLLMAQVCALHDAEEEGAPRAPVVLNERRAQVHLEEEDGDNDDDDKKKMWYLDSGASNHMTGEHEAFSELDTGVVGIVKFGDDSRVEIRGCGTIVFKCQNAAHRVRSR